MITVLRLGHRVPRDARTTTHCALVARAFGADELVFTGGEDAGLVESVQKLVEKWGGRFRIRHETNWRRFAKNFVGVKVHLSVYGMPLEEKISEIRKKAGSKMLVIIGGEKVPAEVFAESDYNVAVTQQPHSEVAALAVFLHEFFRGSETRKRFGGAKIKIIPQERGKKVEKIS